VKYIALDIGNVLCYANMTNFVRDLSDTFNVSIGDASRYLRGFQQIHDLGLTTMERELRSRFNCHSEVTIERLCKLWNDAVHPCVSMLSMLDELNAQHDVQIALLSNIGVEHAAMMDSKLHPIYDYAIPHFSCFVGARKPTMLYYQSFLMQYPEFKGCLYVDDLQENLDASKQFGFDPYLFSLEDADVDDKIREIREIVLDSDESED